MDFPEICLSVGILLSAMNNLMQYYGINSSFNAPTYKRLNKVFSRGLGLVTLLYFLAGFFSYYSFNTKKSNDLDLFIFRKPLEGTSDIPMIICRGLLLIGIFCGASL